MGVWGWGLNQPQDSRYYLPTENVPLRDDDEPVSEPSELDTTRTCIDRQFIEIVSFAIVV